MATDTSLGPLRADARHRVPDPPPIEELLEDAGRQRLAAYYLYTGLLAGVIGDEDLAPARWPPEAAEPMQRLGLGRLAPRTSRGLDAQLTPAEQVTRRSRGRELEFAQLLANLINHGARAAGSAGGSRQAATWLKTSGLGHAVSIGTTLAVHLEPLSAAAGLGTKLVETRIQAGKGQADTLRRLGEQLRTVRAQADDEVADLRTEKRA